MCYHKYVIIIVNEYEVNVHLITLQSGHSVTLVYHQLRVSSLNNMEQLIHVLRSW